MSVSVSRRVRIERITDEAPDIRSFELVDVGGENLPPFSAGAHVDVHLDGGLIRQYSLCNDPRDANRYQIAVLRESTSRGGSVAMHSMREGQELRISEPKNDFPLSHDASHHLLFAGGIGITPILCMAERLCHAEASFALHYCTRTAARTAFGERIRAASFGDRVSFHHDDGSEAQRLDIASVLKSQPAGTHLYVCGPNGFMDAILAAARSAAWPSASLHREYFAGAPIDTAGDAAFEVQVASSGVVIRVAASQTVVVALAAAGVQIPVSCEQGICGTCLTRVIEGTPEHKDQYLTDEERARNDQFTPCCSRSKSPRLVLDL